MPNILWKFRVEPKVMKEFLPWNGNAIRLSAALDFFRQNAHILLNLKTKGFKSSKITDTEARGGSTRKNVQKIREIGDFLKRFMGFWSQKINRELGDLFVCFWEFFGSHGSQSNHDFWCINQVNSKLLGIYLFSKESIDFFNTFSWTKPCSSSKSCNFTVIRLFRLDWRIHITAKSALGIQHMEGVHPQFKYVMYVQRQSTSVVNSNFEAEILELRPGKNLSIELHFPQLGFFNTALTPHKIRILPWTLVIHDRLT